MGETPAENATVVAENGTEEVVKTAKQLEKEAKKQAKLEKLAQKKKQQEQQKAASEVYLYNYGLGGTGYRISLFTIVCNVKIGIMLL